MENYEEETSRLGGNLWDLHGCPVVKTPHSEGRRHGLIPDWATRSHMLHGAACKSNKTQNK